MEFFFIYFEKVYRVHALESTQWADANEYACNIPLILENINIKSNMHTDRN